MAESSLIGNRCCIAGAVKDANDDQLAIGGQVIDGVGRMKNHAQAWVKLVAPGADER